MSNRTKRIAFGCFAVALVLFAAALWLADSPAQSHDAMDGAHRDAGAAASSSNPADATFNSEMAKVNARMHETMEIVPSGNVDRDFMLMMIPHHRGAIDMAVVLLKYGRDEKLKRLAQSIIVEQGQEIAYMRALLDAPPATASTARSIP